MTADDGTQVRELGGGENYASHSPFPPPCRHSTRDAPGMFAGDTHDADAAATRRTLDWATPSVPTSRCAGPMGRVTVIADSAWIGWSRSPIETRGDTRP